MIRFLTILTGFVLMLISLIGCARSESGPQSTPTDSDPQLSIPYRVVTTTGMITDVTEQIAGNRAQVTGLINSGIDPHLFQPTRKDIQTLMEADIVFYNGLLLEGKMTDALIRVARTTSVHAVTEEINESELLSPSEFSGHHDPHVWMDPLAWIQAAKAIRDGLIEFDPDGQPIYEANATRVIDEIDALHSYALEALGSVPENQRLLVTAHDAFNYFGRRYGFEVVGIQGISTESEAGIRDIERIVDLLVDQKIAAVFIETTVSDRNIRALIAGANDRGHTVVIGGSLFSDAMGTSGTYEGSYIGMIDHNVTTIAGALGGSVPARGVNGKLSDSEP